VTVPREALDALLSARRILVASHAPMDGDGLGSGLALVRGLRALGRDATLLTEARLPRAYAFLPGYADVRLLDARGSVPPHDLLVGVDAGSGERLGRAYAARAPGVRVLNVDHHVSNTRYGDLQWIDGEAAATGEMIFDLLQAMGAPIDPGTALCLLVAIVTDTGRFCYSNTTPRTLRTAAALIEKGAHPETILLALYRNQPLGVLRLQARAVDLLRLHGGGRLATLAVPAGFGSELGAEEEDVKDLIDVAIAVRGVVVAALVRGLAEGGTKVSLRSNDDRADVSGLAASRGGGGHRRAAGFTASGPPEEVERSILPDLLALVAAVR
jgi:phosphoesterase RecJ-like protein